MKRSHLYAILACLIILLTSAACSSTHKNEADIRDEPSTIIASADYPVYSSINSLSQKADAIIKGKIIETTLLKKSMTWSNLNRKMND